MEVWRERRREERGQDLRDGGKVKGRREGQETRKSDDETGEQRRGMEGGRKGRTRRGRRENIEE